MLVSCLGCSFANVNGVPFRIVLLVLLLRVVASSGTAWAQDPDRLTNERSVSSTIVMDGRWSDWSSLPRLGGHSASGTAGIQPVQVWAAHDEEHLMLRVQLNQEILLQEYNHLTLYLDVDNRQATGRSVAGIGADIEWTFGQRMGSAHVQGRRYRIDDPIDIGLVAMPTHTSDQFEIAIDREPASGQVPQLNGDTVRVVLEDKEAGVTFPSGSGGLVYPFVSSRSVPSVRSIPLERRSPEDVRVMSYNVLHDRIFDAEARGPFVRLAQAVDADILGFQEIDDYRPNRMRRLLKEIDANRQWHLGRVEPDLLLASRYPVEATYALQGSIEGQKNAAHVLDLRREWGHKLLLINVHLPPGNVPDRPELRDHQRQIEIDAITAFLRDMRTKGGRVHLAENTPVIILGDYNLVGSASNLTTLLQGDVVDTEQFGADIQPDWDGSPLDVLYPRHTHGRMTYTWYNPGNALRFGPGKLDYLVYTGSVLSVQRKFIPFTPVMPEQILVRYNLGARASVVISDHLPIVADFSLQDDLQVEDE